MGNDGEDAEKKELTFEKALEKLEETVSKMESGKLPLDEMMKYFETGSKLSVYCEAKLKELEKKIEILVNGAKNADPIWVSFDEESENLNDSKKPSGQAASQKPKPSCSEEELPF